MIYVRCMIGWAFKLMSSRRFWRGHPTPPLPTVLVQGMFLGRPYIPHRKTVAKDINPHLPGVCALCLPNACSLRLRFISAGTRDDCRRTVGVDVNIVRKVELNHQGDVWKVQASGPQRNHGAAQPTCLALINSPNASYGGQQKFVRAVTI